MCLIQINKNKLASGSIDRHVKIWDVITGNCLITLIGHSDSVQSLFKINENKIASCSLNYIIIWDVTTGDCLNILNELSNYTGELIKINENKIACFRGKQIIIWDIKIGTLLKIQEDDCGRCCLIKINESQIASVTGRNFYVKIWDIITGNCLNTSIYNIY